MSTKTPYSVFDFADRVLTVKSTKALAVKFAIAQDAEYITSPSGETVWANPNGKIRRDHERTATSGEKSKANHDTEEDSMTDTTTTETTEATEATTTKKKTKKPKPEGGCSKRRLESRASRSGAEVGNTGKGEDGNFSVTVFLADGTDQDFLAPSAREAYGAALRFVKELPLLPKPGPSAEEAAEEAADAA